MDDCPTKRSLNVDLDVHPAPDGFWSLYALFLSINLITFLWIDLKVVMGMLAFLFSFSTYWAPLHHLSTPEPLELLKGEKLQPNVLEGGQLGVGEGPGHFPKTFLYPSLSILPLAPDRPPHLPILTPLLTSPLLLTPLLTKLTKL